MYRHKYESLTIAQGDATGRILDMLGWDHLAVELTAGTNLDRTSSIYLKGCTTETGTFVAIVHDSTSALSTSAQIVPIDTEALPRYIQISADTTASAAAGYVAYAHVVD